MPLGENIIKADTGRPPEKTMKSTLEDLKEARRRLQEWNARARSNESLHVTEEEPSSIQQAV